MKKFEVVICGEHEEAIGLEILTGIYAAIQNHGYSDVSVYAETLPEKVSGELEIPQFLKQGWKSVMERRLMEAGRR